MQGWKKRLEEAREYQGLSMRELGLKAGLGPTSYRYIISTAHTIELATIDRLAATLGVSPVWISYGELGQHAPGWMAEEVVHRFWPEGHAMKAPRSNDGESTHIAKRVPVGAC